MNVTPLGGTLGICKLRDASMQSECMECHVLSDAPDQALID